MTPIAHQPSRWNKIILIAATIGGLLVMVLFPSIIAKLGVPETSIWFVDTHALLSASDAAKAGLDPFKPHRFDIFGRPHAYSSWWLQILGPSGLTRSDTARVGSLVVAAFVVVALVPLSPRRPKELLWQLSLILSPPVLFAVNRANNDLIIFALIGTALLLVGTGRGARPAWLIAATAIATGLKFYPVLAPLSLAVLKPARRGRLLALVGLVCSGLALLAVSGDLRRIMIPKAEGLFVVGAKVAWQGFGDQQRLLTVLSGAIAIAIGVWLAWRLSQSTHAASTDANSEKQNLYFATGVTLLVGCFFAEASYGYRWIFALWIAPWLWSNAWESTPVSVLQQKLARTGCFLLIAALWLDGLYCLFVNWFVGRVELSRFLLWEQRWIAFTQLPVWILMIVFMALFGHQLLSSARRANA